MRSATLRSAMTLPRPATTRWSAVSCSSLIRWLETRTARPSRGQVAQERAHPGDALGVHAVERLVHHQHRRVAEQRGGDAEALAHAEGVAARLPLRHGGEAGQADAPRRRGRADRPWECASHSRWLRALRLGWSAAASSSAPRWLSGCRSCRYGLAVDRGRALVWCVEAENDAHRGRLARAVRPDEAGDLARRDGEGHAVEGLRRPEPLAQPGHFDRCFHGSTRYGRAVVRVVTAAERSSPRPLPEVPNGCGVPLESYRRLRLRGGRDGWPLARTMGDMGEQWRARLARAAAGPLGVRAGVALLALAGVGQAIAADGGPRPRQRYGHRAGRAVRPAAVRARPRARRCRCCCHRCRRPW